MEKESMLNLLQDQTVTVREDKSSEEPRVEESKNGDIAKFMGTFGNMDYNQETVHNN